MKKIVKIERNEKYGNVVSSRIIANELGKRHKDVLESLDLIISKGVAEISADLKRIIIPSTYIYPQNKQKYREYLLTKKGFTLYMFNIQGYNEFKIKYIERFEEMEKELNQIIQKKTETIERYEPELNEIEDRAKRIRENRNIIRKLLIQIASDYNWIGYRANLGYERTKKNYQETKRTCFILKDKKITLEDIDKLNIDTLNRTKKDLES